MIEEDTLRKVGAILSNMEAPMKARYRALFTLKNIGGHTAIDIISSNFKDGSSLLKHELAYCLGQMQESYALDILRSIVKDNNQDTIVRHEAAEALGAIGNLEDLPLLENYSTNCPVELAETCQIAVDRIKWLHNAENTGNATHNGNPFNTVDPAPPFDGGKSLSVKELTSQLLNEEMSLFIRYRAMFSLRNMQTEESVLALTLGFTAKSALFRHEIAYVLGQLAHQASEPALTAALIDRDENSMVRHECAEALGAVASSTCMETLKHYLNDKEQIVRESCEVALDMAEYEASHDFEYANALQPVS